MFARVNLLLLLSALLSALTGASVGARPAQPVAAVARAASLTDAVRREPAMAGARPMATIPSLATVAHAPDWHLTPSAKPLLSRRRE